MWYLLLTRILMQPLHAISIKMKCISWFHYIVWNFLCSAHNCLTIVLCVFDSLSMMMTSTALFFHILYITAIKTPWSRLLLLLEWSSLLIFLRGWRKEKVGVSHILMLKYWLHITCYLYVRACLSTRNKHVNMYFFLT